MQPAAPAKPPSAAPGIYHTLKSASHHFDQLRKTSATTTATTAPQ